MYINQILLLSNNKNVHRNYEISLRWITCSILLSYRNPHNVYSLEYRKLNEWKRRMGDNSEKNFENEFILGDEKENRKTNG